MKPSLRILLLFFFFSTANFSQVSPNMENLLAYFKQFRLSAGFDSYVVTDKGKIFVAHNKNESLFLDQLDQQGNVVFRDLKILDEYIFTQGYQKCYTNGSEVKIVASFIYRGGIVVTYNTNTNKLDVMNLKDTVFGDVSCAFDEKGNFHILSRYYGHFDYLKFKNTKLLVHNKISGEEELRSLKINWDTQRYLMIGLPEIFYLDKQLVLIYYIQTIEKPTPNPAEWTSKINYDKIGIHILNLDDYTFEAFWIFDLEENATEKIENITFPRVKVLPSGKANTPPMLYIGGRGNGNDCLYKLELDETLTPIPTQQKYILSAINTETFPEKVIWDFVIDIETIPGSAIFHFVGFEKDAAGKISRYYYAKKLAE